MADHSFNRSASNHAGARSKLTPHTCGSRKALNPRFTSFFNARLQFVGLGFVGPVFVGRIFTVLGLVLAESDGETGKVMRGSIGNG